MVDRLTQRARGARLSVDLRDGGRVAGLWIDGEAVVTERVGGVLSWGSGVQAPWAGAIMDGRFQASGRSVALDRNYRNHAVGGTVLQRRCEAIDEFTIRSDFGHRWPWRGHVIQRHVLEEDRLTHSIELHADEVMPVTVGWRSWFQRQLGASDPVRIFADAGRTFPRFDDGIVSEFTREAFTESPKQFYEAMTGPTVLRWGQRLELWIESDLPCLGLADTGGPAVCVEPMSHRPEMLGLAPRTLVPGEPARAEMVWRWRRL